MRRLAVLARDEVIDAAAVRAMLAGSAFSIAGDGGMDVAVHALIARLEAQAPGALYARVIEQVERPLIEAMLARHAGNQLRAAAALGINRNTLRKRLDALGIDPGRRSGTNPG